MSYPPPNPPFVAARFHGGSQTPVGIVIHGTVTSDNPGSARGVANWWHGPTSPQTSAHYVVDPSEIVQCVGDHTVAYHCGYNTGTIAIELCDEEVGPATRWTDDDSQRIIAKAARLTAELCLAYGIDPVRPSVAELKAKGPHGIYGHNDSRLAFGNTTHSDPLDFPWSKFLQLVKIEISRITGLAHEHSDKSQLVRAVTWNVNHHSDAVDVAPMFEFLINRRNRQVFILQEVKKNSGIEKMLEGRGLGTKWASPEFLVAWDRSRYEYLRSRRVLMSPTRYWTLNYALVVTLRDKVTGKKLEVMSYHPPAHVQAPKHPSFDKVFQALHEIVKRWNRIARTGRAIPLYAGDDNVDEKKGWSPRGGWGFMLKGPLRQVSAPSGTHDARRIDDFRIGKEIRPVGPGYVHGQKISDHDPFEQDFEYVD